MKHPQNESQTTFTQVLHLVDISISIFCCFILSLGYILEGNIVHFTPLHLFVNVSYQLLYLLTLQIACSIRSQTVSF